MFIPTVGDGKTENLIETFQTKALHFTMLRRSKDVMSFRSLV
jgi:hypothetical protein